MAEGGGLLNRESPDLSSRIAPDFTGFGRKPLVRHSVPPVPIRRLPTRLLHNLLHSASRLRLGRQLLRTTTLQELKTDATSSAARPHHVGARA